MRFYKVLICGLIVFIKFIKLFSKYCSACCLLSLSGSLITHVKLFGIVPEFTESKFIYYFPVSFLSFTLDSFYHVFNSLLFSSIVPNLLLIISNEIFLGIVKS